MGAVIWAIGAVAAGILVYLTVILLRGDKA